MGKKAALLAEALAVAGLCILLWPVVSGHRLQADMSAAAQGFLEEARQSYPELLADLQGYNQRIYTERQAGLADALACWRSLRWSWSCRSTWARRIRTLPQGPPYWGILRRPLAA